MITFDQAIAQITILYDEAKTLHGENLNEAFEKNRIEFWGDVHKWDLDAFIERSELNSKNFDIMKLAIANLLEREQMLSASSKDWLIKVLRGEIERPSESAGRKNTLGRDSFIIYAIQFLNDQGMPVNPRTPLSGTSACEVLAQVIKPLISVRTITNIWNERSSGFLFGGIPWNRELARVIEALKINDQIT